MAKTCHRKVTNKNFKNIFEFSDNMSKRVKKTPVKFQAWEEGDKHTPMANRKQKQKKKEESKKYREKISKDKKKLYNKTCRDKKKLEKGLKINEPSGSNIKKKKNK